MNKRQTIFTLIAALLLLLPLVAMQFSTEVHWKLSDFVVAGGLLLGIGLLVELILRKIKRSPLRLIFVILLILLLLLIWTELAVGIFGTPISGT